MKHFFSLITLLLFNIHLLTAQNSPALGTWEGVLSVGKTNLKIVFHIKSENGKLNAEMDSPDQMQYGIKMDTVLTDEKGFVLKLAAANAEYSGTYTDDPIAVEGYWKQAGLSYNLSLKKNIEYKPRVFPQEPQGPFPYLADEVSYKNEKADILLSGTLTKPDAEKRYPAVLLISGSGAQDRDENIMGHKPFLVIADHLSRRGFTVLRVDDRGFGKSQGNAQTATTADFVTDVKAGVKFLKSHPAVDPDKIFLMGHSEGGLIAIMTAADLKKELAGIVLLAGPGVPMDQLLVRQTADIIRQQGTEEEYVKAAEKFFRKFYDEILADKKGKLTAMSLTEKMKPHLKAMPNAAKEALQMTETTLLQHSMTVMMPWFRYFIKIDPKPYLKKVKCPVLAVNGTMDIQVAAGTNLEAICNTLRSKGHKDATCTEVPGLNHLFQRCKSCTIQEYGELEETFAPELLKALENWLRERSK